MNSHPPSPSTTWRRMSLLLMAIGASIAAAPASVIHVDQSATGLNDGSSWTDAYTDLQSAMTTATSVDTVLVAEGGYKPGAARGDSFVLVDGVEAYGGFPAGGSTMELRDPSLHPTILSGEINGAGAGDNSLHVLVIDPFVATCVVDGFTITRGYADGSGNGGRGGGIFIENDAAPILRHLVVNDNHAINDGGAVMVETGGTAVPVFENVTFDSNSCGDKVGALSSEGTLYYASNRHCFIPAVSALAISGTYGAAEEVIPGDASRDSPFDALYHYGTFTNRTHLLNGEGWVTTVLDHELRLLCGNYRLEIRDDVPPFYLSWIGRSILETTDDPSGAWTQLFGRTNGIYRPPLAQPGTQLYRLRFPPAYTKDP